MEFAGRSPRDEEQSATISTEVGRILDGTSTLCERGSDYREEEKGEEGKGGDDKDECGLADNVVSGVAMWGAKTAPSQKAVQCARGFPPETLFCDEDVPDIDLAEIRVYEERMRWAIPEKLLKGGTSSKLGEKVLESDCSDDGTRLGKEVVEAPDDESGKNAERSRSKRSKRRKRERRKHERGTDIDHGVFQQLSLPRRL